MGLGAGAAAGIGAAGAIGGGILAAEGAKSAGDAQADAAERAAELQFEQFRISRQDLLPNIRTGQVALRELAGLVGIPFPVEFDADGNPTRFLQPPSAEQIQENLLATPGAQFRLQEGQRQLDRTGAAGGRFFSGAQLRAANRFGQDFASTEFTNAFNRLSGIAGTGQTAAQGVGALGQQAAANAGNALQNAGLARASGIAGSANALSSGFENAGNAFLAQSIKPQPQNFTIVSQAPAAAPSSGPQFFGEGGIDGF